MAFCEVNFSLFGYSSPLFNSNIGGKLIGDEVFSTTVKEVKKLHIMFKELKEFVQYTKFHEQRLYTRALGIGINTILYDYKKRVLSLEEESLKIGVVISWSSIQNELNQFQLIFDHLFNLTCIIKEGTRGSNEKKPAPFYGTQILDLLHLSIQKCALPFVKEALEVLFYHCNKALFDQLTGWMIHGLLEDPHAEFFVQRAVDPSSKKLEEAKQQLSHMWNTEYILVPKMIPSYISIPVAEKILFIGRAIRLLQDQQEYKIGLKVTNFLGPSDILMFSNSLRALSEMKFFHSISFECVVDKIRASVAKQLWELVVHGGNLLGHLKAFKDYFLLSKGDFYHCFITESRSLMQLPPRANADHDINVVFQQAAARSSAEDDEFFNRVHLRLESSISGTTADPIRSNGWDFIMEYKLDWPLDLIFSQEVVDKYNNLFKLLFSIKRVQLELQRVWLQLHEHGKKQTPANSAKLKPVWLLQKKMAFLIDNLHFYFQVGIIENQHSTMIKKIEGSADFETIKRAHDEFLAVSSAQTFLQIKTISRCLEQILQLCTTFVNIVGNDKLSSTKLMELEKEFVKLLNFLETLLCGLRGQSSSLELLISLLDFKKQLVNT